MAAISIKSMLDAHVAANGKTWEHDRDLSVGASEVGQCLRKTWFAKTGIDPDPDYVDRYGAKLRGDLIENHHWEPGKTRATRVMTADAALDLAPEGKLAGGGECRYCPHRGRCAGVTVGAIPEDREPLGGKPRRANPVGAGGAEGSVSRWAPRRRPCGRPG